MMNPLFACGPDVIHGMFKPPTDGPLYQYPSQFLTMGTKLDVYLSKLSPRASFLAR